MMRSALSPCSSGVPTGQANSSYNVRDDSRSTTVINRGRVRDIKSIWEKNATGNTQRQAPTFQASEMDQENVGYANRNFNARVGNSKRENSWQKPYGRVNESLPQPPARQDKSLGGSATNHQRQNFRSTNGDEDQENGGNRYTNVNNTSGPVKNEIREPFRKLSHTSTDNLPKWRQRKNVRDDSWMRRKEDTSQEQKSGRGVAFSSPPTTDSDTNSIEKTDSNISDVSMHSPSSNNTKSRFPNLRIDTGNRNQTYAPSNRVDYGNEKAEGSNHTEIGAKMGSDTNNVTFQQRKRSLADEASSYSAEKEKILVCTSSDSSTLNYSLEKLPEDSHSSKTSVYSRTSSRKSTKKKPLLTIDTGAFMNDVPVHNKRDEENGLRINTSLNEIENFRSSVGNTGLSINGLTITACHSGDSVNSSLAYSLGNTIESEVIDSYQVSKLLQIPHRRDDSSDIYSGNGNEESKSRKDDCDPSDLVASTLAECRLLLQMSPPPTPLALKAEPESPSEPENSLQLVEKQEEEESEGQGHEKANNSNLSMESLTKFLQCPCCSEDFQEDGMHRPLHSFACDHIICHQCVVKSTLTSPVHSNMVACPECGEKRAFDKVRPVVSRGYCNLVKNKGAFSASRNMKAKERPETRQPTIYEDSVSNNLMLVPSNHNRTLSSFGPLSETSYSSNHRRAFTIDVSTPSDADNIQKDKSMPSFESDNENAPPEEPATPVTRAEMRFLQRKEKLTQSLEKVNRILEKSKASRVHFFDEANSEKMSVGVGRVGENANREGSWFEKTNRIVDKSEGQEEQINRAAEETTNDEELTKCNSLEHTRDQARPELKSMSMDEAHARSVDSTEEEQPTSALVPFTAETQLNHSDKITEEEGTMEEPISDMAKHLQNAIVSHNRIRPDLRIDTALYTPLPATSNAIKFDDSATKPTTDSPERSDTHIAKETIPSNLIPMKQPDQNESLAIFCSPNKDDPFQPAEENPIPFSNVESKESSWSDEDDQCPFLSTNIGSSKPGLKQKIKVRITGSSEKSRKDQQKTTDDQKCPQFMPSLNYSTMQDSDEYVGLVHDSASPMWSSNTRNAFSAKKSKSDSRGSRGSRRSLSFDGNIHTVFRPNYLEAKSEDEISSRRANKDTENQLDTKDGMPSFGLPFYDGKAVLPDGPTYDFSQPSCSQSSDEENYSMKGALVGLVTHKKKPLHRKILGKLGFRKKKKAAKYGELT